MDHKTLQSLDQRLRQKGIVVSPGELEATLHGALSKLRAQLDTMPETDAARLARRLIAIYDRQCADRN
jgi:hypothetical protein